MNNCFWITGLSASGKTTLSNLLVEHIRATGRMVISLDGDELREVLADEVYTRKERIALAMRYARLCKLLTDQGFDVVIAVIGLFQEVHKWNRINISGYYEVFIDTPFEELKNRDPKKLYKRFSDGEINNIAGLDLKVDFPKKSDLHIKWVSGMSIDSMFGILLKNINTKSLCK